MVKKKRMLCLRRGIRHVKKKMKPSWRLYYKPKRKLKK